MIRQFCYFIFIGVMLIGAAGCSSSKDAGGDGISNRAKKHFDNALESYRAREFDEALKSLQKAIDKEPEYEEAYLLRGEIGAVTKDWPLAAGSFQKVIDISPNPDDAVYFNLGKAQYTMGSYQEAEETLRKFLEYRKPAGNMKEKAEFLLESAEFASNAVKNPVPFDPQNLGKGVNSPAAEYHPSITLDAQSLIITRKLPVDTSTEGKVSYDEDFYIARRGEDGQWGKAVFMGRPLNTNYNEGAQSISADGRFMYFTACHRADGHGSCDIYKAKHIGDQWRESENLGKPLNSQSWDSQPSLSADGKTLYFSSGRHGGKGEKDIYVSVMSKEMVQTGDHRGEVEREVWSKPVSLGFNSKGNELSPYMHPDGKTLYFASDGLPGMGGSDVFYVKKLENGGWGKPVNIGYPINTKSDEHGLIVNPRGTTAYFASNREDGYGRLDVYSFELYERARPVPVHYVQGKVYNDQSGHGVEASVEIIDLETEEVVVTALSDEETGQYIAALPINKNYAVNVSAKSYLFHSEGFSLKEAELGNGSYTMDVPLKKLEVGNTVILRNIFFETASYSLKQESKAELNKLVAFLKLNKKLRIEISGHTDNVGSAEDNQALSENRAKAVFDYLIENGISKGRLSYKGYGQDQPIAPNDTEEGRAKNRRTEFKVVGV